MSAGGLTLFVTFTAVVLAIVIWPLLRTASPKRQIRVQETDATSALTELAAQHQATVASLRDLDFDFQTGKLTEVDFQAQRELLMQRGADVLRQIDALKDNLTPLVTAVPNIANSKRKT